MALAMQATSTTLTLIHAYFLKRLQQLSPVTAAVAVTAFCAAGLFVVVDAVRTFADAPAGAAIVADAGPAPVAATGFVATAAVGAAGATGEAIAVAADAGRLLAGVLGRGLGAFGAALFATAISLRGRRASTGEDDAADAHDLMLAMPFGVACWARDGRLAACNARFLSRLPETRRRIPTGTAYAEAIKLLIEGGYMALISDDGEGRLLELHRADNSCLLVEERPLAGGGFVTFVTDVTEQRRADTLLATIRAEQKQLARRYHEEKLRAEAASRSKTAFLAHLSHDIRTPLNHIIGFAELIRHQTYGPIGDARYLTYVDTIKGSGERLLGFFASILELAELESGQRALREEHIWVDDLLDVAARRFRAQAVRAGIALTLGPATGAQLTGDRFCLERMLGNLIENALRFTPTGGKVALAAYPGADGVVLEIADTGIGMSEDRLAQLSQPFAYADASLAREQGGTGLGLPIARAIAEQSGGNLVLDSRPGLGTTVAISLPLTVAAANGQAA